MKGVVQRLKDETRDLRQELKVLNPQVVEFSLYDYSYLYSDYH